MIRNVVKVRNKAQKFAAKQYSNPISCGVIDIDGEHVDVIFKDVKRHRLVKEILAAKLAHILDVPHIPGWVASLDTTQAETMGLSDSISDPNSDKRLLVFASRRSNGTEISAPAGMRDETARAEYLKSCDAVAILVFDELVANVDRQYENLMQEGSRFLAFDHDKILFSDNAVWNSLPGAAKKPCSCTVSDDIGCFAAGTLSISIALAESWDRCTVQLGQALNTIVGMELLSGDDAKFIEDFLVARIKCLPKLVHAHY